jgi:hypothetical protein
MITDNCKINLSFNLKTIKKPQTYRDLIERLEIIKDKYEGSLGNREIILFFYLFSGFSCKFVRELGEYAEYELILDDKVKINTKDIELFWPIKFNLNMNDGFPTPHTMISFNLDIRKTNMACKSMKDFFLEYSPTKYKDKKKIKTSIYQDYDLTVIFDKKESDLIIKR